MDLAGTLTALDTALSAINGVSPYTTTVKNVNARPVNMLAQGDERPAIDFVMLPFSETDDSISESKLVVPLEVRGWIALTDEQRPAPAIPLAALWTDMRTAVKANRTLGGKVSDVRFVAHRFEASETGDACVVMTLQLELYDTD